MIVRTRLLRRPSCVIRPWTRSQSTKTLGADTRPKFPPLRILFCGSDEFSIYSLFALYKLPSDIVSSIEVVCKTPQRTGRGLKHLTHPLIKDAATRISLPVHQISTFTSWTPPRPIDLIIAVSFGLLVPPRILSHARYGGLNVHPSFLPDLYGPAPVHWAMLHRDAHSGVTLQTLHPSKFDQGEVVDQTPRPGMELSYKASGKEGRNALVRNIDKLGLVGAEMLRENLAEGRFLERRKVGNGPEIGEVRHARKLVSEDRRLKVREWSAKEVLVRDMVLGRLWETEMVEVLRRAEVEALGWQEGRKREVEELKGKRTTFERWKDLTDEVLQLRRGHTDLRRKWHERIELPTSQSNDQNLDFSSGEGDSLRTSFTVSDEGIGSTSLMGEVDSDPTSSDTTMDTPNPPRTNPLIYCRGSKDWVLAFRTKDGRYVGPAYAKIEGKSGVPIDLYVGNVVSATIAKRRKQKELKAGYKTWKLPQGRGEGSPDSVGG
ncbi:methionyl-tRNA formyltransferase [Elsinoe australis]|uniref:methionyl-tRNA formyltransferase n=1 Tax=Elsinoe australis TaxID=40998 RepID=A0A2P7YEJ2_9PEZI|nr:methionyl-tRNA formyltransferase [Elsinoe australis]